MTSILKELHKYVPSAGKGSNREYGDQSIVDDQLTVERAVNTHNTLRNGFIPRERLAWNEQSFGCKYYDCLLVNTLNKGSSGFFFEKKFF